MMSNLDGTNHGGSKVPRPSADQTEGEYLSAKKRMRPGEEYESGKKSRLTVESLARSGNNKIPRIPWKESYVCARYTSSCVLRKGI